MAIAVLLLALVKFQRFDWLRYLGLLIAAGLLLLSGSATSLVCCILSLATTALWRLMRGEQRLLAYTLAALIVVWGFTACFRLRSRFFRYWDASHIDRENTDMDYATPYHCRPPDPRIWLCRFLDRLEAGTS